MKSNDLLPWLVGPRYLLGHTSKSFRAEKYHLEKGLSRWKKNLIANNNKMTLNACVPFLQRRSA
jgi:phage antirepressor YoqD-like protein